MEIFKQSITIEISCLLLLWYNHFVSRMACLYFDTQF